MNHQERGENVQAMGMSRREWKKDKISTERKYIHTMDISRSHTKEKMMNHQYKERDMTHFFYIHVCRANQMVCMSHTDGTTATRLFMHGVPTRARGAGHINEGRPDGTH